MRLHLPHQPRPAVLPDLHSPPLVRFGLLAVESVLFMGMRKEEAMIFDEFVEQLSREYFEDSHKFPKKKVKRLMKAFEYYGKMRFSYAKRDYASDLYHR